MAKPNLVLITSKASARTRIQQFIDEKREAYKTNSPDKVAYDQIDIKLIQEFTYDFLGVFDSTPIYSAMTYTEARKMTDALWTIQEIVKGLDYRKQMK